jgi:hypothetical protein
MFSNDKEIGEAVDVEFAEPIDRVPQTLRRVPGSHR